jgi:Zn-dependent peptidase ImmA (M78 family)
VNRETINAEVHKLHKEIWQAYKPVLDVPAVDPIWLLNPVNTARLLGFDYVEAPELGSFSDSGAIYEVAGSLDRLEKRICVSTRFKPEEIRFTGAHEIAHLVLHPGAVKHRDRPIFRFTLSQPQRAPEEIEADYFAASYLLPERLLRQRLRAKFGEVDKVIFNDDVCYFLNPGDPDELMRDDRIGLRNRAFAVARAERFGGVKSLSLAAQFGVSPSVLAIRLEELGLIE